MGLPYIFFILSISQTGPTLMEFGPNSFLNPARYVLQPNDRLLIVIKGGVAYSFQTFVTPDGKMPLFRINLAAPTLNVQNLISPLTGGEKMLDIEEIINVKGKTLLDAKGMIKNFYTKIYGDVEVEIALIEGGKTYIYIEGEVNFPGAFSYYPGMNIDDYIGIAGGTTKDANTQGIYIVRKGKKIYNIEGEKLQMGDRIIIPRNKVKEYLPLIQSGMLILYYIIVSTWRVHHW